MGLISRVSSRTYRYHSYQVEFKPKMSDNKNIPTARIGYMRVCTNSTETSTSGSASSSTSTSTSNGQKYDFTVNGEYPSEKYMSKRMMQEVQKGFEDPPRGMFKNYD